MAVAARVVGEPPQSAGIAVFRMAAQRSGAAGREVFDRPPLLIAQHRSVPFQELSADRAEDIANFDKGPIYGPGNGARASSGLVNETIRSTETAV